MSRLLNLDDFGSQPKAEPAVAAAPQIEVDIDVIRDGAFEKGYESGWEDCHKAHSDCAAAVSSDLAQSLMGLDVTLGEAREDVLNSIRDLLTAIVQQVLPALAKEGLVAVVHDQLLPIIRNATDLKPELVAAPATIPTLELLLEAETSEVRLRPEPAYAASQVSLHIGVERHEVDLSRAILEISRSIEEFSKEQISTSQNVKGKRT